MVAVLKQLSTSLGAITSVAVFVKCNIQQIDSLSPEELRDRIDDLDGYLKEIDAVDEDFIDEDVDVDDYMSALDADLAHDMEQSMSLPSAPVTVPSMAKPIGSVEKCERSTNVAEMEQNSDVCQQFNRNDSSYWVPI